MHRWAVPSGRHPATWAAECRAHHTLAHSALHLGAEGGGRTAVESHKGILGRPAAGHSHFQDHDDVGLLFEGIHTLDQLGVVEAVHDADLLPDVLLLFC